MTTQRYAFPAARLGSSDTRSFVPLYVQLAEQIARLIEQQGDGVVGKAVPSEMQCAKEFGVSRPTVRQAMGLLHSQGLIKKEKGRGTFVARGRLEHDVSHDFEDDMRSAARHVSYRVLAWGPATPSPDIVQAFAPARVRNVHVLKRLRRVDGRVVGIEERFLPSELASRVRRESLETASIFELMRELGTEPVAKLEVQVSARVADREMARLLKTKPRAPLLVRHSTFRNAGGIAVIHGTTTFLAENYTFRFSVDFSASKRARPSTKGTS
jgi:GntR family transcriptional regulator